MQSFSDNIKEVEFWNAVAQRSIDHKLQVNPHLLKGESRLGSEKLVAP